MKLNLLLLTAAGLVSADKLATCPPGTFKAVELVKRVVCQNPASFGHDDIAKMPGLLSGICASDLVQFDVSFRQEVCKNCDASNSENLACADFVPLRRSLAFAPSRHGSESQILAWVPGPSNIHASLCRHWTSKVTWMKAVDDCGTQTFCRRLGFIKSKLRESPPFDGTDKCFDAFESRDQFDSRPKTSSDKNSVQTLSPSECLPTLHRGRARHFDQAVKKCGIYSVCSLYEDEKKRNFFTTQILRETTPRYTSQKECQDAFPKYFTG